MREEDKRVVRQVGRGKGKGRSLRRMKELMHKKRIKELIRE